MLLVQDLSRARPAVDIHLVFPAFLAGADALPRQARMMFEVVETASDIPAFMPGLHLPREVSDAFAVPSEEVRQGLALLVLADAWQADWLLTNRPVLLDARYQLYQHHRIRAIPLSELADWIEVCAHGNGIFWSASAPARYLTVEVFYPWTHWKGRRLASWFFKEAPQLDKKLSEDLRNALLNRYPFILLSRDLVRYYELQMDYFARRGQNQRFVMPLGYHVTNFYLHVWGLLEQLTVIANRARALGLPDRACGIAQKDFWKKLSQQEPGLTSFIAEVKISEWIGLMADMRHAAAHRSMLLPTQLLVETEDSKKTDAEIEEILRRDEPWWYESMSAEAIAALEPQRIAHWRQDKMRVLGENVVVVKRDEEAYVRGPVVSIDADLETLNAIVDAFLVGLFNLKEAAA